MKSRQKESEINENDLYEATNYIVKMTSVERETAETFLSSFNDGNFERLFANTAKLQCVLVHLPIKDLFEKFPWLKKVSEIYQTENVPLAYIV